MAEPKHTPGPWFHGDLDSVAVLVWSASGPEEPIVAEVCTEHVDVDQLKANAALIAAAPDLLAVARAFREELSLCMDMAGPTAEKVARLEKMVDAAIAKAAQP